LELLDSFIVLEGLDGSGTTTQADILSERMRAAGFPVTETSEPTLGPIGGLIRRVLSGEVGIEPESLAMLYAADRHDHVHRSDSGILAAADAGWVVCDRYLFSSLAYQSVQCDYGFVLDLNRRFPLPRHLIYIDLSPEESERRRSGRTESDIFENMQFQRRVYELYSAALDEFAESGMRIHRIEGTGSPDEVSRRIWKQLGIAPIK
jgi:dTMP kinase